MVKVRTVEKNVGGGVQIRHPIRLHPAGERRLTQAELSGQQFQLATRASVAGHDQTRVGDLALDRRERAQDTSDIEDGEKLPVGQEHRSKRPPLSELET